MQLQCGKRKNMLTKLWKLLKNLKEFICDAQYTVKCWLSAGYDLKFWSGLIKNWGPFYGWWTGNGGDDENSSENASLNIKNFCKWADVKWIKSFDDWYNEFNLASLIKYTTGSSGLLNGQSHVGQFDAFDWLKLVLVFRNVERYFISPNIVFSCCREWIGSSTSMNK